MGMAARNEMPASELPPSESEAKKKPELRLVEREMSPAEAEGALGEMGKTMEDTADRSTQDMVAAAKEMNEMGLKYGAGLTAEEANDNRGIVAKAEAAAATLKSEVAIATGADAVGAAEAALRALEAQYKTASGDTKRALEKQIDQATKDWEAARAAAPAKKEATESLVPEVDEAAPASGERATTAEAKVVVNFDDLLTTLSPEARKMASDNFANADETSYGGMVSKQMTPDGVVRVGYKDGTIVETFPGGQKRSNRPEATGAERIPELPAYLQEAAPMYPGMTQEEIDDIDRGDLMVLESDLEMDKEELASVTDAARREQLQSRINAAQDAISRKSTPDGLRAGIAAVDAHIADATAAMNAAPQEERSTHQQQIDQYNAQKAELSRRLELAAAAAIATEAAKEANEEAERAAAEKAERQKQILALEVKMRELEKQYEDAKKESNPDKKAAIERELETTTREWDRLRAEDAAADVKVEETADTAVDATAEAKEATAAVAAAEAAPAAAPAAPSGKKKKQDKPQGQMYDGSKGPGEKKPGTDWGKKAGEIWDWAEKFFGGWTKK